MENVCITGGAQGADSAFALCANHVDHKVKHYGFPKHGYRSKIGEHIDVVSGNYRDLDMHLKIANDWLSRDINGMSDYSRNLLRRNMAIAMDSETAMYAVTYLIDGNVSGGTAWAVTRANQMSMNIYVFDQNTNLWYTNDWFSGAAKYSPIKEDLPPMPEGIYGAVGSRELTESGINAIKNLYRIGDDL